MNPNLIDKLRCYIEFNEDEERFISSVFKLKHFAKGEHFLLAGDVCREAAFIESGVFRFYINTDERDPTYYFAAENEFICEYPSFLRQLPSDETYRHSKRHKYALSVLMIYRDSTERLFSASVSVD